jgi:hypothetical protein
VSCILLWMPLTETWVAGRTSTGKPARQDAPVKGWRVGSELGTRSGRRRGGYVPIVRHEVAQKGNTHGVSYLLMDSTYGSYIYSRRLYSVDLQECGKGKLLDDWSSRICAVEIQN